MMVKTSTILLLAYVLLLGGCKSLGPQFVWDNHAVSVKPGPDKAMVVFIRPEQYSYFDRGRNPPVMQIYDWDQYIAALPMHSKFAYEVSPGDHTFVAVTKKIIVFAQATLEPGKTYYLGVVPKKFIEFNTPRRREKMLGWLDATRFVTPTEDGRLFAQRNESRVNKLRKKFFPIWLKRPAKKKVQLNQESAFESNSVEHAL